MSDTKTSWLQLVATALLSGAVASAGVGVLFVGYTTRVQEEVRSQRQWKERSVAELLGPINIQFDRTKRAFDRWNSKNDYLEAKVIKTGNETVRDLLLTRAHLLPPELLQDAGKLVEHYDVWLELFEQHRGPNEPRLEEPFTFAGPAGYPFPTEAEEHFRQKYREYWDELYGHK